MTDIQKQLAEALEKLLEGFSVLDDGPDESDVRHALCLMTDGIKEGRAALSAHLQQEARGPLTDSDRLDWLEEQTKKSPTGISFDYCRHVEDGYVQEKGFRFMRRAFLGERALTLRDAIDRVKGE